MMEAWQVFSLLVFFTAIYWSLKNRFNRKREQALQEQMFPEAVCFPVKAGIRYDIMLSDGRAFNQAEILGTAQGREAEFLFGYENMLVLRLSDGRKAYVRQACIRCMIESEKLENEKLENEVSAQPEQSFCEAKTKFPKEA